MSMADDIADIKNRLLQVQGIVQQLTDDQFEANLGIANLSSKAPTLGSALMATSVPVTISSNQTGISVLQNVVISTANSSTANLASLATFTGTSDSTIGYVGIGITFIADQKCTIEVQQSSNGTNWDIIDTFSANAGEGIGRIFQTPGAFFRTLVTNNGGGATTFLRLQSTLRPISDPLPRSLSPYGALKVDNTGVVPTYGASIIGLVPAATPTDIFEIAGSATRTIRLSRIRFTGTRTASTTSDTIIVKRSTANTGGTSTLPTVVPYDSASPVGSAVVKAYTANPTLGTLVGNIKADRQFLNIAGTGSSDVREYDFGFNNTQHLTLRGVAETLAINLNGVTMAGGLLDIWITWHEE